MTHTPEPTLARSSLADLFVAPASAERFAGLDPDSAAGRAALAAIAERINATRRPGAKSDIPAGVTYLTQLVILDLDFPTRESVAGGPPLDLGLIYGNGPRHDACCYQVPFQTGSGRHLLRVGRTRPTASSPAWGAARDLPRASCPNLDARPVESRSEVLVPDSASDSNLLLGQIQVLWALLHNAVASDAGEGRRPEEAFEIARRITREVYRAVVRTDVLGTWLLPALRPRYQERPAGAPVGLSRVPAEFRDGVARLGHGLVREIYSLNDQNEVVGLRTLLRHTSTGRPFDMPLTEEWLLDFSRFFAIGGSVPQRARALGPHVARPFATGAVAATEDAREGVVLADLTACARGGLHSVRSLVALIRRSEPHLLDGWFAGDEARWQAALADWLGEAGLDPETVRRLSQDPPLTLFLMLEAEADAEGRSLGALGSVLMGETIAAALGPDETDPALEAARASVFGGPAPTSMAETIRFLQRHYRFAEGARLHALDAADPEDPAAPHPVVPGGSEMLDINASTRQSLPRIEVADYIEMGRLVAQWAADPATRPATVQELKQQLDGIAIIPDRIKKVEFAQSTTDTLVLTLPVREMIEESIERMSDPMGDSRYPLPQFYADHYRPGFGPVMTSLDILLARVGDYTIAQCR